MPGRGCPRCGNHRLFEDVDHHVRCRVCGKSFNPHPPDSEEWKVAQEEVG